MFFVVVVFIYIYIERERERKTKAIILSVKSSLPDPSLLSADAGPTRSLSKRRAPQSPITNSRHKKATTLWVCP